jgi:shikimate kinase
MKRVLITGMSGTGKSTLVGELAARRYQAVDADYDGLSELVNVPGENGGVAPGRDWLWQEQRIQEVLARDDGGVLFISGCAPNQWKFYAQFDHIVLLTAPASLIVERLAARTTNTYGKHPDEVARVLHLQRTIEPLLRSAAGLEVDTSVPLSEVVELVLRHVGADSSL